MRRTLFTLGCLLVWLVSSAQYRTIGDAAPMGDCIRLTPDEPYSEGIAYNTSRLDLNNTFEIEFEIYLGNKNDLGADGITFVMHNDPRGFEASGSYGEGMGYGNMGRGGSWIAPSVAVEFDTYQNFTQNDPSYDHVALLVNGVNLHPGEWKEEAEGLNLEDDRLHNFRFRWNPTDQSIRVNLDGRVVYQGKKDLINAVFGGNTKVIWGFTASTGRKYNLQYFCLKRLATKVIPPRPFVADKRGGIPKIGAERIAALPKTAVPEKTIPKIAAIEKSVPLTRAQEATTNTAVRKRGASQH